YGAEGANGVIRITTRRGALGPPTVSFTQEMGISTVGQRIGSRVFSAQDAINAYGQYVLGDPRAVAGLGQDFDHESALVGQVPFCYRTNLAVGGGIGASRYHFSVAGIRDGGPVSNTFRERQSGDVGAVVKSQRFTLDAGVMLLRSSGDLGAAQDGRLPQYRD